MARTFNVFKGTLEGLSELCRRETFGIAKARKRVWTQTFYIYDTKNPNIFVWTRMRSLEHDIARAMSLNGITVKKFTGHPEPNPREDAPRPSDNVAQLD